MDTLKMGAVAVMAVAALPLVWMAAAAGWWWLQRRWSEYQHGADRCACGLYDLEDIHAQHTVFEQHTEVAVHSRDMCAPRREMIP
jgi:hypothetical protein